LSHNYDALSLYKMTRAEHLLVYNITQTEVQYHCMLTFTDVMSHCLMCGSVVCTVVRSTYSITDK